MKQIVLLVTFTFSAFFSFGQSRADYQAAMASFKQFYNGEKVDEIKKLYAAGADMETAEKIWNEEKMKELKDKYGELKEYKYIGDKNEGQPANLYKLEFEESTAIIGIYLDTKGNWLTFSFEKSSPAIERMIRAN